MYSPRNCRVYVVSVFSPNRDNRPRFTIYVSTIFVYLPTSYRNQRSTFHRIRAKIVTFVRSINRFGPIYIYVCVYRERENGRNVIENVSCYGQRELSVWRLNDNFNVSNKQKVYLNRIVNTWTKTFMFSITYKRFRSRLINRPNPLMSTFNFDSIPGIPLRSFK